MARRRARILVVLVALAVALTTTGYGAWLTDRVAATPTNGANMGTGFAGLGTLLAVVAVAAAILSVIRRSIRTAALIVTLVLLGAAVLPLGVASLCIIDEPRCDEAQ